MDNAKAFVVCLFAVCWMKLLQSGYQLTVDVHIDACLPS